MSSRQLLHLIDAERMSDGLMVMLKIVMRGSTESEIALYLSSNDYQADPMNHSVPIIDVIRDESEPHVEFLVMPLLRPFDEPPFFCVDEVLDFMKQILEVSIALRLLASRGSYPSTDRG